ncbi:MAG: arylsulfotransferase family protein [Candidatus Dormibacteria bacterium]
MVPVLLLGVLPLVVSCAATPARPAGRSLATSASCPGVSVYPSPGTRTAAQTTQISFRNIVPASLHEGQVQITGSKSGPHTGSWLSDSDHDGASFYPAQEFAAGETVSVSTELQICGSRGTFFSFGIAVPPPTLAKPPTVAAAPTPALDQPTVSYASIPGVKVPKLKVTVPASFGSGYIFESPQGGTVLGGPMIVNGQGQLVWFAPLPPTVVATDFRVQRYQGKPVLTFWEGKITDGHGAGEDIVMNSSYQVIKTIQAGNGYSADLHEFLLSFSGDTAWITAFNTIGWDVNSEGGTQRGAVLDGIVQEVDVSTGNVLFEWHSLDHAPLSLSNQTYADTAVYDYFHVNSIDPLSSGLVLISSRNTSTVYGVATATGKVLWRLGGKRSSFQMGPGAKFAQQHNAVMESSDTISIFDDEDANPSMAPGRAIVLRLNFPAGRATLERAYSHHGLLVPAQGSVQILTNGDVFVGWGSGNYTSAYTKSGKLLFDAHYGTTFTSYRAYFYRWVGTPTTPPSLATSTDPAGDLNVYASWNGSTQTRSWRVLGGPDAANLTTLATVKSAGFQTAIHLSSAQAVVQVVALGAHGQVLSSSEVVTAS